MCFGFWNKFKKFADKRGGNVVDLGIGIIIGSAFTAIVKSFVDDILTPPLGLLLSGTNLENYFILIKPGLTENATYTTPQEAQADGAVTENVGLFLNTLISFFLICFSLFWILYIYHAFYDKDEKKEKETTSPCPWCQEEVSKDAVKCKSCTSIIKEKVPRQYRRDDNTDGGTLIDLQE